MNRPDNALAESSPDIRLADHADGNRYRPDIDECRASVADPDGPDYIAHLTSGIWDFSVHDPGTGLRPEEFRQAARQLSLFFSRVERSTNPLDSGALIRMVIQGDRGALIHDVKVAGQSFFAATLDGSRPAVDRVDRAMSQVVDDAARRIGAPSMLWGGYRKRGDSGNVWTPSAQSRPRPVDHQAGPDPVSAPVTDRCRNALHLDDLHFVGLYRGGRLIWRTDILQDHALGTFFQRVTPQSRRDGYDKVIGQVTMDSFRIQQLLDRTRSTRLTRLVIDVARGAIYVLPLENSGYSLVGVTLIQTQVNVADQKLTALRDRIVGAFRPRAPRA